MCLYPRMIRNAKYKPNKKNGGVAPTVSDERTVHVPIACGKCMECKKQKAREWQVRLMEDIKHYKGGRFITLTFSNESIRKIDKEIPQQKTVGKHVDGVLHEKEVKITGYDRDNAHAVYAVRHFLERWRKKYKRSLRHWLVTELGHNGTENIHLHGIVWQSENYNGTWTQFMHEVEKIWEYGFVWKYKKIKNKTTGALELQNFVGDATINYCVKYITKADIDHRAYDSKVLTSPGIGRNYTDNAVGDWTKNKFNGTETIDTYRTRTGHKIAMPIYWRNKIYDEKEREQLWLNTLDKQERWVGGERVDVSVTEKEYYALLEYYRKLNAQLGYGSDSVNWSRKQYEHQRRAILLNKRLGYDYPIEWDA